jgi:hypothetical protein
MEVSGQVSEKTPRKKRPSPIECEVGWVWMFWRRENFLPKPETEPCFLIRPVLGFVTISTMLSWQ